MQNSKMEFYNVVYAIIYKIGQLDTIIIVMKWINPAENDNLKKIAELKQQPS